MSLHYDVVKKQYVESSVICYHPRGRDRSPSLIIISPSPAQPQYYSLGPKLAQGGEGLIREISNHPYLVKTPFLPGNLALITAEKTLLYYHTAYPKEAKHFHLIRLDPEGYDYRLIMPDLGRPMHLYFKELNTLYEKFTLLAMVIKELERIHQAGQIHSDIVPSNILYQNGNIYFIDPRPDLERNDTEAVAKLLLNFSKELRVPFPGRLTALLTQAKLHRNVVLADIHKELKSAAHQHKYDRPKPHMTKKPVTSAWSQQKTLNVLKKPEEPTLINKIKRALKIK